MARVGGEAGVSEDEAAFMLIGRLVGVESTRAALGVSAKLQAAALKMTAIRIKHSLTGVCIITNP